MFLYYISILFSGFMTFCVIYLRNECHKTRAINIVQTPSMCILKIVSMRPFIWSMCEKQSRKSQWTQSNYPSIHSILFKFNVLDEFTLLFSFCCLQLSRWQRCAHILCSNGWRWKTFPSKRSNSPEYHVFLRNKNKWINMKTSNRTFWYISKQLKYRW